MNILLVEDEPAIAEPLANGLRREGFDVQHVLNGGDALTATDYDVVLLDLRLPDMDGLDVARELRKTSSVPIIITTARSEEIDMVVGLEIGADDYVVKPFGVRQIIARIRAVTRRGELLNHRGDPVLTVGALTVDRGSRQVDLSGSHLDLTPREFDLLARLALEPGTVISREDLYRDVWGGEWFGSTKTIDVHIGGLRRKMGDPAWIEASRGVGFRLVPQP